MSKPRGPLQTYLCIKLSEEGWAALRELYDLGCDLKILLNAITVLTTPDNITLDNGQRIAIRPNDDRNEALNGMDMRDLEQITDRGKRVLAEFAQLQKDAERLRKTLFVQELDREGFFEKEDLLSEASSISEYAKRLPEGANELPQEQFQETIHQHLEKIFKGILALPEEVKKRGIGAGQHPDYDRQLSTIFEHIEDRTGEYRYSLLSKILLEISPNESKKFAPRSLEQWKRRLGTR